MKASSSFSHENPLKEQESAPEPLNTEEEMVHLLPAPDSIFKQALGSNSFNSPAPSRSIAENSCEQMLDKAEKLKQEGNCLYAKDDIDGAVVSEQY